MVTVGRSACFPVAFCLLAFTASAWCQSIDYPPDNTAALVNTSSYLNCTVTLDGDFIQWFHHLDDSQPDGTQIYPPPGGGEMDDRFDVIVDETEGIYDLIIKDVRKSVAGTYDCKLAFADQIASGEMMAVKDLWCSPPPGTQEFEEGERILLSCGLEYSGYKRPTLQWTSDEYRGSHNQSTGDSHETLNRGKPDDDYDTHSLSWSIVVQPEHHEMLFHCHLTFEKDDDDTEGEPPAYTDTCSTFFYVGVRPGDTTQTPTTTTIPVEAQTTTGTMEDYSPDPPQYKVILVGNFSSINGSDYTMECTQAYGNNLQQKAAEKIPLLNSMLGTEMCSSYFEVGEISIASVNTMFSPSGSVGSTQVTYALAISADATIAHVYSCADELTAYLQEFDNWGLPVIPPVDGCPHPVFDPQYFEDGRTGNDWLCLPSTGSRHAEESSQKVVNQPPGYSLSMLDLFTTYTGDDLNPHCTDTYASDWQIKTTNMVTDLDIMIMEGQLCPGLEGKFTVLVPSSSFNTLDDQGSVMVTFYMRPTDDVIKFSDVYACVSDIFDYAKHHENWGDFTLLPPPPGCPLLVFDPPVFTHNGEEWICL